MPKQHYPDCPFLLSFAGELIRMKMEVMRGNDHQRFFAPIKLLLAIIILLHTAITQGQKTAVAARVDSAPRIDGIANDDCWKECPPISGFTQYEPDYREASRFSTRVYIGYDDQALYVLAMMTDGAPDSILMQLGERDSEHLNADAFTIAFDTYHKQADAYYFQVSASNIQSDSRESDELFDAVWESAVHLHDTGWSCEIRLPWSALRFPTAETQIWGLQLTRNLRRHREISQWALEEKETGNEMLSWGRLEGIRQISPPLRLSLTPYASYVYEKDPGDATREKSLTHQVKGGLDLKLGISEAFTMDITLLPDFSQIQSDNEIKNLSAFETTYDENRPFFREGVELFAREDLFYSRRIGARPTGFSRVDDVLQEGEWISENPSQTRLLNATKISGRNSKGLALGIFNALTDQAQATITNEAGAERNIQTEAFSNYNIAVADKQWKGGSSLYFINTNVSRAGNARDANVSGAGLELTDKKNRYELELVGIISNINQANTTGWDSGKRLKAELEKSSGQLQFAIGFEHLDKDYNINDLGLIFKNNRQTYWAEFVWREYEPFGIFRNMRNAIGGARAENLESRENENTYLFYSGNTTFRNYLTIWWNANLSPFDRYDYYEPRQEGRYYVRPGYLNGSISFSSDYRKPIALDGSIYFAKEFDTYREQNYRVAPIFRVNRRLSGNIDLRYNHINGAPGYVDQAEDGSIIFGTRELKTHTNSISTRFAFSPKITASLWLRHYWRTGRYHQYLALDEKGRLSPSEYDTEADFSYNSFNIDLGFRWEFAPGSLLTLVWKNAVLEEAPYHEVNFFDNLRQTLNEPQWNTFSIKFLYYLDYQQLKSRTKSADA